MASIRTQRKHLPKAEKSSLDLSVLWSLLVHALLGFGLYYISQPHLPKVTPNIDAMLVTPDMLRQMQANAKAASANAQNQPQGTAAGSKTAKQTPAKADVVIPKQSTEVYTPEPTLEELNQQLSNEPIPAVIEKAPVQTPSKPEPIFKPVSSKKAESKPKKTTSKKTADKEPAQEAAKKQTQNKQKTGKLHEKSVQQSELALKKNAENLKKLEKQKQEEEKRRKQYREQLKKADTAKRKEREKQRRLEKENEQKRIKELKNKEKQQDKAKEKRRAAIAKAKKENDARIKKQAAENRASKTHKAASLAEKGAASGSGSAAPKGPTAAEKRAAAEKYINLIASKVKGNWQGNTDKIITVPVRIRLSPSGNVMSARVNKAGLDPELKASIESAVYDSSPLPVPSDPALFAQFKSFTFRFRTK